MRAFCLSVAIGATFVLQLLLQTQAFYYSLKAPLTSYIHKNSRHGTARFVKDSDLIPETPSASSEAKLKQYIQTILSSSTSLIMTGVLTEPAQARSKVIVTPDALSSGAIGYEAAESAYSPMQKLYSVPLLPQSALLNILPLDNILVGQLQAFLESYVQLISPNSRQRSQIVRPNSALWVNLRINAQRAAGMFVYNQKQLQPYIDSSESADIQGLRNEESGINSAEFRQQVIRLVVASKRSEIGASVRCMRNALNNLCQLAYLQTPLRATNLNINSKLNSSLIEKYDNAAGIKRMTAMLPKLQGRAVVKLTFRRPGPASTKTIEAVLPSNVRYVQVKNTTEAINSTLPFINIEGANDGPASSEVTLIVDGINHPLNAGNFVDLCLKGFYEDIPVQFKSLDYGSDRIANFVTLGDYEKGYVDPLTGRQRRIPLEVLREDEGTNNSRFTVTGAARNSAVFTRSRPVQSFATVSLFIHVVSPFIYKSIFLSA